MSVLLFTLLIIYVGVAIFFIIRSISKGKSVFFNLLPTAGWLLLMTVPFLLQCFDFDAAAANPQAIGILIIGSCLLVGDVLYIKPWVRDNVLDSADKSWYSTFYKIISSGYFYLALFLAVAIYHLISMETVPLFYSWTHPQASESYLVLLRENAAKLLNVPFIIKYFFTWATSFFAVVGTVLFLRKKKWIWAAAFIVLALIYARITLNKAPTYILIISLIIYCLFAIDFKIKKPILIAITVVVCMLIARPIIFLTTDVNSGFKQQAPVNENQTDANKFRFAKYPADMPGEYQIYNWFMKRAIFMPSEVSNFWYLYAEETGNSFGYSDLLPQTRGSDYQSPSNVVGLWSYHAKWPNMYGPTVSAYCSLDGDAYARGGWVAVVCVGMILLILRLLMKYLLIRKNILSYCCYIVCVIQMALNLAASSLQAFVVAHGFIGMMFLMLVLCVTSVIQQKKNKAKQLQENETANDVVKKEITQ
ncbi:MAG: hypothetical protein RR956_07005 [Christensenella sp.]